MIHGKLTTNTKKTAQRAIGFFNRTLMFNAPAIKTGMRMNPEGLQNNIKQVEMAKIAPSQTDSFLSGLRAFDDNTNTSGESAVLVTKPKVPYLTPHKYQKLLLLAASKPAIHDSSFEKSINLALKITTAGTKINKSVKTKKE